MFQSAFFSTASVVAFRHPNDSFFFGSGYCDVEASETLPFVPISQQCVCARTVAGNAQTCASSLRRRAASFSHSP